MTTFEKLVFAAWLLVATPLLVTGMVCLGALVYAQATAADGDCPHSGFCPDCPAWEEVEL